MDMNERARRLMAACADPAVQVEGGLALRTALGQARLDGSLDSVGRIDQLLTQIRTRLHPTREAWERQPGAANFVLALAFHLGEVVARQRGIEVDWMSFEEAQRRLPHAMRPPRAPWSRVLGVMGGGLCVPVGVIEEGLFAPAPQMSCAEYVRGLVQNLDPGPAADENERCQAWLRAFFAGGEIPGGLGMRPALQQCTLDFSPASLEVLDQLLAHMRGELQGDAGRLLRRTDFVNFLRWVAYYAGTAIARSMALTIRWMNHEQLARHVEGLEAGLETTLGCVIDDRAYFPLGILVELLFAAQPQRSLRGWAGQVQGVARPMFHIRQLHASQEAPGTLGAVLEKAAMQAGFLAAHCLFLAAGGGPVAPSVLVPRRDGTAQIVDYTGHADMPSAHAAAAGRMEDNPDGAPFQVLAFDAYVYLWCGRTEAFTLVLHCYGGGVGSIHKPATVRILCPYRSAGTSQGFAIHSPKLLEVPAHFDALPALAAAFYLGVQRFRADGFSWRQLLDESI